MLEENALTAARIDEVSRMILLLLGVLLVTCVAAPWFGADRGDCRSEKAHPETGWFPPLIPH